MEQTTYGLPLRSNQHLVEAPKVDYKPRDPRTYSPAIALVGCGGISTQHLSAYQKAGYHVVALCDPNEEATSHAKKDFFPDAQVYGDYREVLRCEDIEVVDFATHPEIRFKMMKDAIDAGKHILSQKPFVMDLDDGLRLLEAADARNLKIAVNQNGRWAPHFSYMRNLVATGALGEVAAVHMAVSWNHNWIKGTHFEEIHDLILFDFGIHWFDMMATFMRGKMPERVYATTANFPGQTVKPPMLAQVVCEYATGLGSMTFDADTLFGEEDRTVVIGRKGTVKSSGPDLNEQYVTVVTEAGVARPELVGTWFPDGFYGTMAELLCAIEEDREPENSGRNNLESLALCFAAVESAKLGKAVRPGDVRSISL